MSKFIKERCVKMKREEKKQAMYYNLRDQYAREFSELMIQRLGLTVDESTGLLVYEDIFISFVQLQFTFNSFKYVPFENAELAEANPDTIKVFDPYNELKLAAYCVMQFMVYVKEIDVNNCVSIMSITNSKMNAEGHGEITFTELMNNQKLIGHDYNRDSLKYMDLIYIMDDAADPEYDALRNLDLVNYDEFEM